MRAAPSTLLLLQVAILCCFFFHSAFLSAGELKAEKIIGNGQVGTLYPTEVPAKDAEIFSSLSIVQQRPDGGLVVGDRATLRIYNFTTGNLSAPVKLTFGDSLDEVFYRLDAGVATCKNALAYDATRDVYYQGCDYGIAVTKGRVTRKLIAGDGTSTSGPVSDLLARNANFLSVSSDGSTLRFLAFDGTGNNIYVVDLNAMTAQSYPTSLLLSEKDVVFCDWDTSSLFYVSTQINSGVKKLNYVTSTTTTAVSGNWNAVACGTSTDTIHSMSAVSLRSHILSPSSSATQLSTLSNPAYFLTKQDTTYVILDNFGLKVYQHATPNPILKYSIKKSTTEPHNAVYLSLSGISMYMDTSSVASIVNSTYIVLMTPKVLRVIDFANDRSVPLLTEGFGVWTQPGASIFVGSQESIRTSAIDENGSIYAAGSCSTTSCLSIFRFSPTSSNSYSAELLAGNGKSGEVDGPFLNNTVQVKVTAGFAVKSSKLYMIQSRGLVVLDLTTKILSTLIPSDTTRVDGNLSVARTSTNLLGIGIDGDQLIMNDDNVIRYFDLQTNQLTTRAASKSLFDRSISFNKVFGDTTYGFNTNGKLYASMNNGQVYFPGCTSGAAEVECDGTATGTSTSTPYKSALTTSEGLVVMNSLEVFKMTPAEPDAPVIYIMPLNETAIELSWKVDPSTFGGASITAINIQYTQLISGSWNSITTGFVNSVVIPNVQSTGVTACVAFLNVVGSSQSSCVSI